MQIVQKNLEFLKKVSKTKSIPKRNRYLEAASSEEILAILEICINILKARVKLTKPQHKKLALHADYLRKLSRKKSENTTRKYLQSGEGIILPALILPLIAQLAANLING